MTTMRQQTKAEFWQGHIQAAKSFHGSLRKYCDKENLNFNNFQYWRNKFKENKDEHLPVPSPFVPVQVQQANLTRSQLLPDPKWVAEIIYELHARLR